MPEVGLDLTCLHLLGIPIPARKLHNDFVRIELPSLLILPFPRQGGARYAIYRQEKRLRGGARGAAGVLLRQKAQNAN